MIDYAKMVSAIAGTCLYFIFVYMSLRIGFLVIDALEKYLGM